MWFIKFTYFFLGNKRNVICVEEKVLDWNMIENECLKFKLKGYFIF